MNIYKVTYKVNGVICTSQMSYQGLLQAKANPKIWVLLIKKI